MFLAKRIATTTTLTLLLPLAACGEKEPSGEKMVPARATPAPRSPAGAPSSAPAPSGAAEIHYQFDQDFADLSDMALGEVRTYPLRLSIEGAGATPEVYLASSCDCLSASFASLDAGGGEIMVEVDGFKPEDIDGAITLEDADHDVLAEHVVRILVTRKPFVSPPLTLLDPGEAEFVITAGYAFRPEDPDEGFDLIDLIFDESRFEMLDWNNEERLEMEFRLKLMAWPMRRLGEFDETLDETITIVLENPDTRLEARVRAKP